MTRITRADGTILFRHQHRQKRVLDAEIADTVTAVLQQVITRGTGTAAAFDHIAAGKTGTAQDHHDAWFVGYTPDLATAVWVGSHEGDIPMEPPTTPIRVTGGSYPARIWQRFMKAALAGTPVQSFHPPPVDAFTPDSIPDDGLLDPFDILDPANPGTLRPLPNAPTTTTRPRPRSGTTIPSNGGRIGTVPDVMGRRAEEATATLHEAGYQVSRRAASGGANVEKGTVVSQTPPGGSLATRGSTVTIFVAGG